VDLFQAGVDVVPIELVGEPEPLKGVARVAANAEVAGLLDVALPT
jgi:hypothetical protein